MSRTLVIDCATAACSVALFDEGECLAGDWRLLGRGHAEQLVPMIAALPDRGRAARIAVDIGPGSFTGIRVGLAAARALALAWGATLCGYQASTLVAAMARDEATDGPPDGAPGEAIDVMMAGGHGEWFFQPFAAAGSALAEVRSLPPAEALARSTAPLVAGSVAAELVAARGSGRALDLLPDARRFALLAPGDLGADPHPAYGRGPDARLPASASA